MQVILVGASLAAFLLAGSFVSAFQTLTFTNSASFSHTPLPSTGRIATAPLSATAVSVDENAPRDIGSFEQWAANCGVQRAEGIQLTTEDGDDYFVTTTQSLPAGSPVLFVPNQMVLSSVAAEQEFRSPNLLEAEAQLAQADMRDQIPLFRLFVKILSEYEKGDQSPYFPWLNAMPRRYYNGVSMTYACFDCLPPYASRLSKKERERYKVCRDILQRVSLLDEATTADKDLVKFAYNAALTRSTVVGTRELRISPMADMFNHGSAETEVGITYDGEGNCVVTTTRDVPAGCPLRISLGDGTDPSPLFAKYGFLDESSPATYCKLLHLKKEMRDLRYDYSDLLFSVDGQVSPAVYDVVLYSILANADDSSLRQKFYQACLSGNDAEKNAYHQEYLPYTLEALQKHVDGMLRTLDELSDRANGYDLSTHPRIPLILKHNEFVRSTFLNVKANVDAMCMNYA